MTRVKNRLLLIAVLLALLLRAWAAWQLPVDFDEPIYLQAGYDYAQALRSANLQALIDYPENREHPPLIKLLYGAAIAAMGKNASFESALYASRAISAFFGTLAVLLLALLNPLAGLFLALQTTAVKYTSQAYLEALPSFTSLLAVAALLWSHARRDRGFWVSAFALGLTAAGKYSYFPILLVVLYLFFGQKKYPWQDLLLYLALAALVFFVCDPALWHDPFRRLFESLTFHASYSQSAHVQQSGYPWYQPFIWVLRSMPAVWHPEVFVYFGFDGLITLLAVFGLGRSWKAQPWVVVWIVAGMLFTLLWPTKWPQYSMLVIPALCLSASVFTYRVVERIREEDTYWNWISEMVPRPGKLMIAAAILIVGAVTVGTVARTIKHALDRRGWWQLDITNTVMPGNTVNAIIQSANGDMVLGTAGGVVIFSLSPDTNLPGSWQVFTPRNSELPDSNVFDVVQDASGGLWFATQSGLARLSGGAWQVFRAADSGLPGDRVDALALGAGGRLWVGTDAGLAVYDGMQWRPYTQADSGLASNLVTSLAVAANPQGDVVWAGTPAGLSRLDASSGEWLNLSSEQAGFLGGGISDLMIDSQGRLWVSTLGSGLNIWDGANWTRYRVSNSSIPSNTVQATFEGGPGLYWVATALPTNVGGVPARFDGQGWQAFIPDNSGYSGAEPLAFALDSSGRLWIGTRTNGVNIYQFDR